MSRHLLSTRMRVKRLLKTLMQFSCICVLATLAQAHSVISAAYIEGDWIEGEVGFSNGDMALPGTQVQVQLNGVAVGSTETGEYGIFRWPIDALGEYRFRVNLSAGHVAEIVVSEAEIRSQATGFAPVAPASAARAASKPSDLQPSYFVNSDSVEALVGAAVARQIKPMRKEIARLSNKNELRDLLGGLGLIAGCFGVLYGFSAHRKLKQHRAAEHDG